MGLLSSGAKAAAKNAVSDAGLLSPGIRAYHGSPYSFDEFSTSQIGTGEGAQAYGRGLYFAEREKTAKGYRDALKGNMVTTSDGVIKTYGQHITEVEDAIRAAHPNLNPDNIRAAAKSVVDDNLTDADVEGMGQWEGVYKSGIVANKNAQASKGSMYEVNIAATPDQFIDWDLPLDEQSESVMSALKKTDWYQYAEEGAYNAAESRGDNAYGMDLVRWLEEDGAEDAAQMLKDAGIKGVQYADAQTRFGKGPKTKNFVVYDDKLIDITRKYGISVPLAAAVAAGTMTPEEAQAGFLTTPANLIRIGMLNPQSAQNPSAVKSAMTKYDKAMRDNKAFRFREKIRADVENQTQSIDIGERNILDFSDLVGKVGVPVAGDTSITGKILQTIGGQNLDMPVGVEGGSNFGLRYLDQGFGWASMEDAARKKQRNFTLAADETGMQPVGIFNAMGREAVNFSTPPAETMLQQARALPIKKSDIKAFDDELRKSRPDWVGLYHPGAMDQIMGRGEYPQKGAGKLRSEFVQEMSKARHRDVGFPIKEDVHSEILQPEIADLPIGSSGFSMFDAQPGASVISGPWHQSYDTIIPGVYIGGLAQSVPARRMFPKTFADLDQRINKAGKPFTEQQKTGSLVMDPKLYEVFDDQWADGMYQYLRGADNKQKGAASPAALAATAATGAGLLGAGQFMQPQGGMGVRSTPAGQDEQAFISAQPPTAAPSGGLVGPDQNDYGLNLNNVIGMADAGVNAAAGMIAPVLSAPGAVARYAADRYIPGVNFSADDMANARKNTESFFDYQPKTQQGQQFSNQGMQALGGLLGPVANAADDSYIINAFKKGFGLLDRKEQELLKALTDMSPI